MASFSADAGSPPEQVHALLIPLHPQGHLNPMMHLAKRLASKGLIITFVTVEYNVRRMMQVQHTDVSNELGSADQRFGPNIRLVGLPDGVPEHYKPHDSLFHILYKSQDMLREFLDTLLQRLQTEGPPVTCIISDSWVHWTQAVASKWNIPRILFWPQSAAVFSTNLHLADIILTGHNPFKDKVKIGKCREPASLISCIPGIPPLHPADLPFRVPGGEMPLAWLYNSLKEQFESVHKNEFVVCNSFSELEGGICESLQTEVPDMRLVGPLFLTDFLDDLHSLDAGNRTSLWKEEECLHWLQEQPASSVLYVSFGSFTTLPASQLMEIARGLVSSQQRFLWVIRPDMVEGEASETLSDVILQCSTTPLAKVIQWASQPVVLSHPAIGGFFSHCGWNSLLESVSMGVPILGWPQMADQVMNCWMMVNEWKMGVGVEVDEKNEVGWEAVERGVRIVMESKEGREMKV